MGRDRTLTIDAHSRAVDLKPISYYTHALKPSLPAALFAPVRSRLAWLALHVATVVTGAIAIHGHWGGAWGAWIVALLVGHAFAGMAFVGHETLHGAVVRDKGWRTAIGWLCFLPFTLSPRVWVAWHNRVHHGHTMQTGIDPDAYPTLEQFQHSRVTQVADFLSLARGRFAGFLTLLLGFTGQSMQIMWRMARRESAGYLSPHQHNLAVVEQLAGIAVWTALGIWLGFSGFLFAFLIPLAIGNAVVMAYIYTNHNLSPLTEVNDPLLNSLTVTAPRIFEIMHLNFGLHVEHHLFPSMSSAHAPRVRDEIKARWPERYQSMSIFRALWLLSSTPRVYKDATTLVEPYRGRQYSTLLPSPANLQVNAG